MNAERWRQVKAIFHDAVECEPQTRAEFLHQQCGGDDELRKEVESLLAAEQDLTSVLDRPLAGAGAMAAASPWLKPDPMIGRTIGNYLITSELARGGMGIVYRARHVTLPRDVVVKCIRALPFSEEAQDGLRARFRREAYIQSQLDHQHIVRVYEFFAGGEEYFLVMEYVPGSSVRSMLDKSGRLPVWQAVDLTIQALEGIANAHGLKYVDESTNTGVGIIHRDIKPGNLLVDEHGLLKLTDFGIAKVSGQADLTQTGFNPGTVDYMSPEQIRGQPVDARSDLYSLGVTLYEMLTGRVPFPRAEAGSGYDRLKAQVETDAPPVRALNPEIPPLLADVISRSLQRDPNQRWQTAAEFREALLWCQQNRPAAEFPQRRVLAPSQPHLTPLPARVHSKFKLPLIAFIIAASLGGAFWFGRGVTQFTAKPDQMSIAVLPFHNLSGDKNMEYFSDGITEELLNSLASIPGLRVAGRTSSFQFREKTGEFRVIGEKLKVASLLEGSVRMQGKRAKVGVQLINVSTGYQLWSQSFDLELNDIFAVQEEIARAVTGALKVNLLSEKKAPATSRTSSPEAYTAYLQGRYLARHANKEAFEKASSYFEKAIQADPQYAPAWQGLGDTRSMQALQGYVPREEGMRKARQELERALALDPDLAEAHSALGRIKALQDSDWTGSDASYRRARELQPRNASVIGMSGTLARALGHFDEAIALYIRSTEIDPLHSGAYYSFGLVLYYAGRYEEATAAIRKSLELSPNRILAHCVLGYVYIAQNRPREALAEMELEPQPVFKLTGKAIAYHALGSKKESDKALAELITQYSAQEPYTIAEVYAFRGEKDRAFDWLERAYTNKDNGLAEVKGDPMLKSLAGDPRYTSLLKKLRLPI